ncbi:sporulation protein [Bacillus sp. 31A1R]|uniref:Sporulation protein n=1 Tax=Robertmurraya mangrovi TaxID=3098077 RepID=A0ABU5J0C5_9BACI|nr:sporulation protein [Bacillus sp. 31A1R]MDZ5472816.1 sporulation protein [Bacillus sp. 31A1R]
MLLRKYMSLLGIGSAKIDLILPKEKYKLGEQINGYFLLKGGTIEQQLKRIDCDLICIDKQGESEKVIDSVTILTSKCIESEETNQMPFTFTLPASIPFVTEDVSFRFTTRLTFNEGVKSIDQDFIEIVQ